MNSKKCHSVFQDEWFTNKKYKFWIAKIKNKKISWRTLCQKEIDFLTVLHMIWMHLVKKTTKMSDHKQGLEKFFFKKQEPVS